MNRSKAFTLVELLISMVLISIVTAAVFYFSLSSLKLSGRINDTAASLQITRSIISRISSDIIQSSGAGAGSTSRLLILGDISYEFRDGKVRRQEGSDVYYMTTEGEIMQLQFYYSSNNLIKIEITGKNGAKYVMDVHSRN